jgi:PilZ domain-containing protein
MDDAGSTEKRAIRRFALQLPVTITGHSGENLPTSGESRDVSSHGICFFCDSAMQLDSPIEFTLTLPSEITMSEPLSVRCTGRVVRVERQQAKKYAVAAAINNYEFLSDYQEQEVPQVAQPQQAEPVISGADTSSAM